ncbi:MAG: FGGY-family carbohydrate kinase [Saccharofermentanales bacterium]|jgi:glycerol kinase
MANKYIISIDQSTQGTKALLFNEGGDFIARTDMTHKQLVDEQGWISHDADEIYNNTVQVIKNLIEKENIDKNKVIALGISNQRETSVLWDRETQMPLAPAVVWQCARAMEICEREYIKSQAELINNKTGMKLSPYFPAAKIAWLLENVEGAKQKALEHKVCHGTIDSWLVFKLTNGASYKTDYSNASRTQLFNIFDLKWDEEICELFGIELQNLPEVIDSDAFFGNTSLNGYFEHSIPIHAVLGDSHAALFGQGCLLPGMMKATYGTGSSIMMNIGEKPVLSQYGVVTSLAWSRSGKAEYVLEGNLNYTGAVVTWLKDDMKLIMDSDETEILANEALKNDGLYFIPAFTGLGAPYWDSRARAMVVGMDRTTGKSEFVRATLECIAYQIMDVVRAMEKDTKIQVEELRVDGGATRNRYLMQFQSDILNVTIQIPEAEELSGIGAAYMAGISLRVWDDNIFKKINYKSYVSAMDQEIRKTKIAGWKEAIGKVLTK